jgi:hypothetical protein
VRGVSLVENYRIATMAIIPMGILAAMIKLQGCICKDRYKIPKTSH